MLRDNGVSCFNIREFIQSDKENMIGKEALNKVLSDFVCTKNRDVEIFLRDNAVEFTKKNQSVTYLMLSDLNAELLGYFTLTIKPITVDSNKFSNTIRRKLLRVGELDEERKTITLPAYLIAQLGKNYSVDLQNIITGDELLEAATDAIAELQYGIGGTVVFLEAEDNDNLKKFYIENNGYKEFETREIVGKAGEPRKLIQMLKVM